MMFHHKQIMKHQNKLMFHHKQIIKHQNQVMFHHKQMIEHQKQVVKQNGIKLLMKNIFWEIFHYVCNH